jgi:hypothetical protein
MYGTIAGVKPYLKFMENQSMRTLSVALMLGISSTSLIAQDITLNGTISTRVKPAQAKTKSLAVKESKAKTIKLLKFTLSDKAKHSLADKAINALSKTKQFAPMAMSHYGKFPTSIQLGMNGVPVLDQGEHGSCVTFAITTAIDAALNQGDLISQLCQLQLGNYFASHGYGESGWDGSLGRFVLSQMDSFGIVSKAKEAELGCGGLYSYPIQGADPTSSMTLEEFHQMSESMTQRSFVSWSPILDFYESHLDRIDTNKTLAAIKTSLVNGERVTFEVLLLDFELGVEGAVGKKGDSYDTWVLTPEIARDVYLNPNFGGHEMVITGYDDNAIAVDDEGRTYQGLLTMRNSWGDQLGDHGDFYMSYDYFKLLVLEAQRIRTHDWDED